MSNSPQVTVGTQPLALSPEQTQPLDIIPHDWLTPRLRKGLTDVSCVYDASVHAAQGERAYAHVRWYSRGAKPPAGALAAVCLALRAAFATVPPQEQQRVMANPPVVVVCPVAEPKVSPGPIPPRHRDVNSGLTTRLGDVPVCVVWRKEEAVKVCVHEYLHYALEPMNDKFNAIVPATAVQLWGWAVAPHVVESLRTSETVIEILAEAIVGCDLALLQHWSMVQMVRMVTNQSLTLQEFFGFVPTSKRFRQETAAFEYYVLRALFLSSRIVVDAWSRGPGGLLMMFSRELQPTAIKRVVAAPSWLRVVSSLEKDMTTFPKKYGRSLRMTPLVR